MSRKERKAKTKKEIRESIISAARQVAQNEGWDNVTIRKIAKIIEYTPPIVYEYFENKEALFEEIVYHGFSLLFNKCKIVEKQSMDIREYMRVISIAHWDFALNNRDLFQLIFSYDEANPSTEMIEYFDIISSIFSEFSNNNEQAAHELEMCWLSLVYGSISCLMFFAPPPEVAKSPFELFKYNIDYFLKGLSFKE